MSLRGAAKSLAWRCGAMRLYSLARHGQCLTVVMLHRVLPALGRERDGADPHYTVSPELLSEILAFLDRNYSLVNARDVLESLAQKKPLPRRPLLITFDDGWRDNIEWALPVLRGRPWTLFVSTDAISEPECWWQEVLFWAWRSGRANLEDLWHAAAASSDSLSDGGDFLELVVVYGRLSPERRRKSLASWEREFRSLHHRRHMLSHEEIAVLRDEGVEIGSHGASHLPLSRMPDAEGDLRRACEWLRPLGVPPILSFPHGRYNDAALAAARKLGYGAMFTSDAVLNPCPGGWLCSDVIGRIALDSERIANADGTLAPQHLAGLLLLEAGSAGRPKAARRLVRLAKDGSSAE